MVATGRKSIDRVLSCCFLNSRDQAYTANMTTQHPALTDSTGLPLTRAPKATAHQNTHVEGPAGSSPPPNGPPNSPFLTMASRRPTVPGSLPPPKAECCRLAGVTMIFTIVSRMWLHRKQRRACSTGVVV